jgi:transposase
MWCGAPKAITATTHKLARLVYTMLQNGASYVDAGRQYYEEQYRARTVQNLKRKALVLGFQLLPKQVCDAIP